jgi:hypothetical protein
MINLSDEDDPMLFGLTLPQGQLVVQYMEVLAMLQTKVAAGTDPTTAQIVECLRESSRTPEVAVKAPDHVLLAAWARMSNRVQAAGNV